MVFLLALTASKNIKTRVIQSYVLTSLPLFLPFLSRCLRIRQSGCSLVFLACSFIVVSRGYSATPKPQIRLFFASSFLMAQMMSKMGCHRRLGYARLLNRSGCGFVTVFVPAYVSRFPHYSARSLKKGFSVSFHSVQPLPNSHNKSVCFLVPQHFTHLFSICFTPLSSIPLRYISSTASASHTCRWYHSTQGIFTATVQPTASSSYPIQRQQKHPPNPCAYCIGRQLFSSCPFLSSTLAQLAVGSQRFSRTFFHLLPTLQSAD